jgi:hypothetical protein
MRVGRRGCHCAPAPTAQSNELQGESVSRIRAAVVIAGLAALLAACGSPNNVPANRAFYNRVNRICFYSDFALGVTPTSIPSAQAEGRLFAKDNPIYAKQLREMRAVKPPSDYAKPYAKVLKSMDVEITLLRDATPYLLAGNVKGAKKYTTHIIPAAAVVYTNEQNINLLVCAKSW